MNRIWADRIRRGALRCLDMLCGRLYSLRHTLDSFALKPPALGLELANRCNANCVFCPISQQQRRPQIMSDQVFLKAVGDFVACGGGNVELTPIVGESLLDPQFLPRLRYLCSLPQIGRIWLITNGILLDQHGIDEILGSGIDAITISTAGFDRAMYQRVYRCTAYERMRKNVLSLVAKNAQLGHPVEVVIALRPDRPLEDVVKDPDFQPILAHKPIVRCNWGYTDAGGRVDRGQLPRAFRLRRIRRRPHACAYTYWGPAVLSNGVVIACNCVAAMDAEAELAIGRILTQDLINIWRGNRLHELRASFGTEALNPVCSRCNMYAHPAILRTSAQRELARQNRTRAAQAAARQIR